MINCYISIWKNAFDSKYIYFCQVDFGSIDCLQIKEASTNSLNADDVDTFHYIIILFDVASI